MSSRNEAEKPSREMSRRGLLRGSAAVALTAVGSSMLTGSRSLSAQDDTAAAKKPTIYKIKNKRIKQSVVPWCYKSQISAEKLVDLAAELGLSSVELCDPKLWPRLKKHGMVCAISRGHGFSKGLNQPKHWPECLKTLRAGIEMTGDAGFPNIITFSGMRDGLSDAEGIDNVVKGAKQIMGLAEKRKVNVCIEMLNTRDDTHPMKGHPGYQCDNLDFAVEVCRRVGSERMKILFDIYHVQIMHGDVIRRLRAIKDYIGHYHTAGNPGRGELDGNQEIQYKPIMEAIVDTGYQGYVGQEFIPVGDAVQGLSEAVELCDV